MIEYAEKRNPQMKEILKDFREQRTKLQKRSEALRKQADSIRKHSAVKAAELMQRSATLKAEAEKMTKGKISTEEIRRRKVLAWLALETDEIQPLP